MDVGEEFRIHGVVPCFGIEIGGRIAARRASRVDEYVDRPQLLLDRRRHALRLLSFDEVGDKQPRCVLADRQARESAASRFSRLRETSATFACSLANACAQAYPIPLLAPVTTTTLPLKCRSIAIPSVDRSRANEKATSAPLTGAKSRRPQGVRTARRRALVRP
jgi:hypothetical protein